MTPTPTHRGVGPPPGGFKNGDRPPITDPPLPTSQRETPRSDWGQRSDCDLPILTLEDWRKEHPEGYPQIPVLFKRSPAIDEAIKRGPLTSREFLDEYGDTIVQSRPGYAQAGGQLALPAEQQRALRIQDDGTLRNLASAWHNQSRGRYVSLFNCHSIFCHKLFSTLGVPRQLDGGREPSSTNLLIGGPGSGLPFHFHRATWQMQIVGDKAWFLVPPSGMNAELSKKVGPFLYPAEGWAPHLSGRAIGERPLVCVQRLREILFFLTIGGMRR